MIKSTIIINTIKRIPDGIVTMVLYNLPYYSINNYGKSCNIAGPYLALLDCSPIHKMVSFTIVKVLVSIFCM